MRTAIGALAILSAGILAATQPALAQTTQATVDAVTPPSGPIPGTNPDSNQNGDGGLVLSVWSPNQPLSLVYYTGLTYSQVLQSQITPAAGLVLDFGDIPSWDLISSAPDLVYHLIAIDGSGTNAQRGIAVTHALGAPIFTGTNGDINTITGSSTFGNFIGGVNSNCSPSPVCVYDGTNANPDAQTGIWGPNFNGALNVAATADVGSALGFYQMVGAAPAANASTPTIVTRYENASGLGTWLLTDLGRLTYTIAGEASVVPLPAAAWLLLSGLAGFGVISRRRNAA